MYGEKRGDSKLKDRSVEFLEQIPAEKNRLIERWSAAGIQSDNAFYSQSLIQLKNTYCKFKKCLSCEIGNQIIIFKRS
jgi:hypothetical protein